jgi:hypothetical protein
LGASIREYTPFDKLAVLELGKLMHAESPRYKNKKWDDARAGQTIDNVSTFGILYLAEEDGQLIGMIGGVCSQDIFGSDSTAYAMCHYVVPEKRKTSTAGIRLLRLFENWAFNTKGAFECGVNPSTGIETEAVTRVYEKSGYVKVSNSLVKIKE